VTVSKAPCALLVLGINAAMLLHGDVAG